jgi:ArsR family transcriptional regulator
MEIVRFAKALSDEVRARLVSLLLRFELNVGELVQALGMGQSRISRHLKILADCGLIECRREGLWAFYRVAGSGAGRDFLERVADLFVDGAAGEADRERAERVIAERVRATRRFFDTIAADWQRLSREILGSFDLAGEIRRRLPECGVVADLGCGPGELLAALVSKAGRLIGVDNSPRMLALAGERFAGNPKVGLRIGELNHLPMRDWEADCAVLSMVLHHVPNPKEALVEAGRVLKLGGSLIVAEFDRHELESMRSDYGDHRLGFERAALTALLEQARFKVVKAEAFPVNRGLSVVLYECVKR